MVRTAGFEPARPVGRPRKLRRSARFQVGCVCLFHHVRMGGHRAGLLSLTRWLAWSAPYGGSIEMDTVPSGWIVTVILGLGLIVITS